MIKADDFIDLPKAQLKESEFWSDMKGNSIYLCADCEIFLSKLYIECPECKKQINWGDR